MQMTSRKAAFVPCQRPPSPLLNGILAALPAGVLQRWLVSFEVIELEAGQVLCESGSTMSHVVFPLTGFVSLLYYTEQGASSEVAMVGREGLVGISRVMGGGSMPYRAVVQAAGQAVRIDATLVRNELETHSAVRHLMLRYTQAMLIQMAHKAVCNRHHALFERLCTWLLLGLDRVDGTDLVTTQENLSANLGVRREGVTAAALRLQSAGVIHYWRGHIKVLNRHALEAGACECYAAVKGEHDRLLPVRPAPFSSLLEAAA